MLMMIKHTPCAVMTKMFSGDAFERGALNEKATSRNHADDY